MCVCACILWHVLVVLYMGAIYPIKVYFVYAGIAIHQPLETQSLFLGWTSFHSYFPQVAG